MRPFVTHFNSLLAGGAGIAAKRLHLALCRAGVESRMFFGSGESTDSFTIPAFQNQTFFWRNAVALANRWSRTHEAEGGFISSPGWVRKTPVQRFGELPKVINLHWVAQWLDLPSFLDSLPDGIPVVWSLHDLIPITGGCSYPGECDHFTRQCGHCPKLKQPALQDVTNRFFRTKARCYAGKNLHFVGNSEWTTAQIRRSGLAMHAKSIRTIHLGLDPSQFSPVDKILAREALRVPNDKFVIGFASVDFNEKRKGAGILLEALKALPSGEIVLLVLGASNNTTHNHNGEIIHLGSTGSAHLQSIYYSALDVFVMPSQIETFGLTALEAMSCATPTVSYSAGGLADVVADRETGLVERDIGSVSGMVRMLDWMRTHPVERAAMGIAARRRVIEKFSDSLMARRYLNLYQEDGLV